MVMTSHDRLGETGKATGVWLEEFAAPYYLLIDADATVTLASPAGGRPPIDPRSDEPGAQTRATRRFSMDAAAQNAFASTRPLSGVRAEAYDAVFYPGGHGPLWDLVEDRHSIALIEAMYAAGKPIAAVCHGPAVLRRAHKPDGSPLVAGKDVTGFSNSEERAIGFTEIVPFLVEDALKEAGGNYSCAADWQPHVVTDGLLITGQNPASAEPTAKALLNALAIAQEESRVQTQAREGARPS